MFDWVLNTTWGIINLPLLTVIVLFILSSILKILEESTQILWNKIKHMMTTLLCVFWWMKIMEMKLLELRQW